jgi:hypothetical protein
MRSCRHAYIALHDADDAIYNGSKSVQLKTLQSFVPLDPHQCGAVLDVDSGIEASVLRSMNNRWVPAPADLQRCAANSR